MRKQNKKEENKTQQNGRIEGRNVYEQAYSRVLGKEIKNTLK